MANFAIETNMAQGVLVGGSGIPQKPPTLHPSRQARPGHARHLRSDGGLPVMLPTHFLGPADGSAGKPVFHVMRGGER